MCLYTIKFEISTHKFGTTKLQLAQVLHLKLFSKFNPLSAYRGGWGNPLLHWYREDSHSEEENND